MKTEGATVTFVELSRALFFGFVAGVCLVVVSVGGPRKVLADVKKMHHVYSNRMSLLEARTLGSDYIASYTQKIRKKLDGETSKTKPIKSVKKSSAKKKNIKKKQRSRKN